MRMAVFFVLGYLAVGNFTWSDAGWALVRPFDIKNGQVYSQQEHPSVILEKEFLVLENLEEGKVRAVFRFSNDSDQPEKVECAFPIRTPVRVQTENDERLKKSFPEYNQYFIIGGGLRRFQADPETEDFLADALKLPVELSDRVPYLVIKKEKYPTGLVETKVGSWQDRLNFNVSWNGNHVDLENVLIDYGDNPRDIVVHFRFAFEMEARQHGTLEIRYSFPTWIIQSASAGAGDRKEFVWDYIIGTARTWKGALRDFVVVLPQGPKTVFPPRRIWDGPHASGAYNIYRIQDWKPALSDQILVKGISEDPSLKAMNWTAYRSAKAGGQVIDQGQKGRPLYEDAVADYEHSAVFQDFVKDITASSYLEEKTELFLKTGIIVRPTDFAPQKGFDGLRESAWVPAGGKKGIGQWIQFTLTRPIVGISIQNGFLRVTPFIQDESERTRIWEGNARIKSLEILKMPGEQRVSVLELEDQMELQDFSQLLEPGTYRMVIRSAYPGTKWQDVGLGEVRFFPWDKDWIDQLSADSFFASNLKDLPEKLPLWDRENLPVPGYENHLGAGMPDRPPGIRTVQ
jgi:hypothetical protein